MYRSFNPELASVQSAPKSVDGQIPPSVHPMPAKNTVSRTANAPASTQGPSVPKVGSGLSVVDGEHDTTPATCEEPRAQGAKSVDLVRRNST